MTGDDEKRRGTGAQDDERPGEREASGGEERPAGSVPEPEPEEAPELLGERSDYPIAWDGEERG